MYELLQPSHFYEIVKWTSVENISFDKNIPAVYQT